MEIPDRQTVVNCLNKHRESLKDFGIQFLALFGSVALNEATPNSDLDFLVEFEGPATFDHYMDLKFFLEDLFKRPVDLVTNHSLKTQIRQTVLEEAIRVELQLPASSDGQEVEVFMVATSSAPHVQSIRPTPPAAAVSLRPVPHPTATHPAPLPGQTGADPHHHHHRASRSPPPLSQPAAPAAPPPD